MLLVLLLAGCSGQTYVEIGMGTEQTESWEGRDPTVTARLRQEWDRTYCELEHISNLRDGWPLNDRTESVLNQLSCGVRIRLR